MFRRSLAVVALLGLMAPAGAVELYVADMAGPPVAEATPPTMADQLPQSTLATGDGPVARAWLAGATARYAHGVLGDALEASRLVVQLSYGRELAFELPEHRVFEDLTPRLVDLDADGRAEVVLVESDSYEGASLAVYQVNEGAIRLRARSPFIGRANRWLNPVGAGDFDGDGRADLALIRTPHIGGVLELYRFSEPSLELMATRRGYSTHVIGSTELGLGAVVQGDGKDRLLLPNQRRDTLALIEWRGGELVEVAAVELPAQMTSSLQRLEPGTFAVRLSDGAHYLVTMTR